MLITPLTPRSVHAPVVEGRRFLRPILKRQKRTDYQVYRRALMAAVPPHVFHFIDLWVDLEDIDNLQVMDTSSLFNFVNVQAKPRSGGDPLQLKSEETGIGNIVNLKRLNDIRYINKYLESANENLREGGYLIGCVETSVERWHRLMAKYPAPFNLLYYCLDFMVKRVWPKLPFLKKFYFFLTNGRNRVISEMEVYGRLRSCGFRHLDVIEAEGKLYFVAEKIGKPAYNMEATYGPFIKLRRVGKNGKIIKVRKLRTMYPYAEYLQEHIFNRVGLQSGGKLKNDPRVSTLGRFLRKFWLDEMPMIVNLLKGEMKFFGVRPLSAHYLSLYPQEFQEFRSRFKPGLIPPFYVDLPDTLEEIVASERKYLETYERLGFLADFLYTFKAIFNIFVRGARSK